MNSMSGQKLKGIPYTGALPATLTGTKAGYLHRYKIYGNTEQTGTPTPENPIVPSECGERTGNLFTKNNSINGYLLDDGSIVSPHENLYITDYIPISAEFVTQVSDFGEGVSMGAPSMCFYDSNKDFISGEQFSRLNPKTFSVPTNAAYLRTCYRDVYNWTMLNSGSTALPYEPYGYKLPLTSGSTPVDIYLGESQTTRRIKKLVLTGEENWTYQSEYTRFMIYLQNAMFLGVRLTPITCTHYITIDDGRSIADVPNNAICIGGSSAAVQFFIKTDGYATAADFKSYLAQQYANGTPVTIWYVLATEQTGTLNEPLRKIGDYADTIDSTQTTTQIPTSANSTTISWAGQGLAPSEFDSIQEWVDIPTYTRVNGAWVADN